MPYTWNWTDYSPSRKPNAIVLIKHYTNKMIYIYIAIHTLKSFILSLICCSWHEEIDNQKWAIFRKSEIFDNLICPHQAFLSGLRDQRKRWKYCKTQRWRMTPKKLSHPEIIRLMHIWTYIDCGNKHRSYINSSQGDPLQRWGTGYVVTPLAKILSAILIHLH